MMYILDTSFFLEASKLHMPLESQPAFWDWLVTLAQAGVVSIPESVYEEIIAGNDSVADWIKAHKQEFVDQQAAFTQIRRVMTDGYGFIDEITLDELWADPWVIAHASAVGGTVVTSEKPGNQTSPRKKKIPSVCKTLKIPCCTITAFVWQMLSDRQK